MLYYSVLLYWSCGHRWGAQGPNLRRTVSSCVSSEETWQPGWATSLKRSTSFPCALVMAVLGMKLSGEKWRELLGDMVVSRHIYSIYNYIYLHLFIYVKYISSHSIISHHIPSYSTINNREARNYNHSFSTASWEEFKHWYGEAIAC